MYNEIISNNWIWFTPIFIIIGLATILFIFKNPEPKLSVLASDFGGLLAGIGFIIMGILLPLEVYYPDQRQKFFGILLIIAAFLFYFLTRSLKRIQKLINKQSELNLICIFLLVSGIIVLFLN